MRSAFDVYHNVERKKNLWGGGGGGEGGLKVHQYTKDLYQILQF